MNPGALGRLTPPFEGVKVVSQTSPKVELNSEVKLSVPLLPFFRIPWLAKHTSVQPPDSFIDEQLKGPFAKWVHQHTFKEDGESASSIIDQITYRLPLHPLSTLTSNWFVRRKLERMFRFRHLRTHFDLSASNALPLTLKTILITGASGLVGTHLKNFLEVSGYEVLTVSRSSSSDKNTYQWDIRSHDFPLEALERADAVIHLAGESIASGRWTPERKKRIESSRVEGTKLLVNALGGVKDKPSVLISISATGLYGTRGDEELTESSAPGDLFVSRVAVEWEKEAFRAETFGVRTVIPRLGIVLTPEGGALKKMLPPFTLGLGGPLGSGDQWMSCVSIDDVVYAIHFLLEQKNCSGTYNLTCPQPTTNLTFTKTLGALLNRPAVIPVPKVALRLALGELADELLLASSRVIPARLLDEGFTFRFPDLESSLAFPLGEYDEKEK